MKRPRWRVRPSLPIVAAYLLEPHDFDTPLNLDVPPARFRLFAMFWERVQTRRFDRRLSSGFPFLWSTSNPSGAFVIKR